MLLQACLAALGPSQALAGGWTAANPWSLQLSHDRRGSAVGMSYRLRFSFSFSDLGRPAVRAEREPVASMRAGLLGILKSTRLSVHGVRLKPFDRLIRLPVEEAGVGAAEASSAVPPAAVEALKADARREMKRWLVRTLFDRALPQARRAPGWQKDAVAADLALAGRAWSADN